MASLDDFISSSNGDISYQSIQDNIQFIIDENLRTIAIPSDGVVAGVEGDKDVNKINFKMVRYYSGFDLSKFDVRINYSNANNDLSYYQTNDLDYDEDYIYFSWLVSENAAKYVGNIIFVVRLALNSGSKAIRKFYSTTANLQVLTGLEVDTQITETDTKDIIANLKNDLTTHSNKLKTEITTTANTNLTQLNNKKEEILTSIPDDYNKMSNEIKNLRNALVNVPIVSACDRHDDCSSNRLSIQYYGKNQQDVYNGYQLMNYKQLASRNYGGVNVTNGLDGLFIIEGSGIPTALWTRSYLYSREFTLNNIKPGVVYFKDCNNGKLKNPEFAADLMYNSSGDTSAEPDAYYCRAVLGGSMTVTQAMLDDPTCVLRIYYKVLNTTVNSGIIKPMLYQKGNGIWERYVGGKYSPSPSYPQKIIPSHGISLTVGNRNLLEMTIATKELNGIKLMRNSDSTYAASGTATSNTEFILQYFTVYKGVTYTLKGCPSGGSTSKYILQIWNSSPRINYVDTGDGITFTAPVTAKCRVVFIVYSGVTIWGTIRPMITYSDNSGTYIKHESQKQTMYEEIAFDGGDSTYTVYDGYMSGGGVRTDQSSTIYGASDYIEVTPYERYTYKYPNVDLGTTSIYLTQYDANKKFLASTKLEESQIDFKMGYNAAYVRVSFIKASKSSFKLIKWITLRSLPDGTKDSYIDGVLTKRVGEITLDGTNHSEIVLVNSNNGFNRFTVRIDNSNCSSLMIDKLKVTDTVPGKYTEECVITYNGNALRVVVSNDTASTVNEMAEWLKNTRLNVHYKLPSAIIKVLNKDDIYTYKYSTSFTTEYLSGPEINLVYIADAKRYIDNCLLSLKE